METAQSTLDPDVCYRAVSARDSRFDGHFFTAVRTTGIYCRPICPARTPNRTSCEFHRTAAAAESAGFRPCLRCRPELAPGRVELQDTLAEAIFARLSSGALDERSLESLAAEIGLSSRQVRRIVVDRFGVTPIEIAQTQRLLFAKKLLQETRLPITQLAFAAGFQSVRRFNAAFRDRYGMPPSAIRRDASEAEAVDEDGTIVLRLAYRPPYDWETMAQYLRYRATPGVEYVDVVDGASVYRRTVHWPSASGGIDGWIAVAGSGDAARDVVVVTLSGSLLPVLMEATHRLREMLDLDADPERIAAHLADDPLLAPEVAAAPGLRMPGAWDRFELSLRAVLGQQVSVVGASTLAGRMAARFGRPVATPFERLTHAAATPEALASADLLDIAAIGMPRTRANTVRELARFAAAGGLRMPIGTTCDAAVARLDALPGIGPWTAHYVAMRALRYPDAFPAGDLGLRKALGALEGASTLPTERTLELRSQQWRPWRAYAAAMLWHALGRREAEQKAARPPRSTRKKT
jgi:AraC family transcriptional regulator, regulatory protein of adaptative response / DNA-3-methyladenine glycosylase II